MKKNILLFALLYLSACVPYDLRVANCPPVDYENHKMAKWLYYNASSVNQTRLSQQQIRQMFGCNYQNGDQVYEYSNFWNHGYILVRAQGVVAYYKN